MSLAPMSYIFSYDRDIKMITSEMGSCIIARDRRDGTVMILRGVVTGLSVEHEFWGDTPRIRYEVHGTGEPVTMEGDFDHMPDYVYSKAKVLPEEFLNSIAGKGAEIRALSRRLMELEATEKETTLSKIFIDGAEIGTVDWGSEAIYTPPADILLGEDDFVRSGPGLITLRLSGLDKVIVAARKLEKLKITAETKETGERYTLSLEEVERETLAKYGLVSSLDVTEDCESVSFAEAFIQVGRDDDEEEVSTELTIDSSEWSLVEGDHAEIVYRYGRLAGKSVYKIDPGDFRMLGGPFTT